MPRTRTPATRKNVSATSARSKTTARNTSSSKVPTLNSLTNQLCPNCRVGVLQVVRYDPDALHEVGQSLAEENQNPSGGAYEVDCRNCGFHESRPLGIGQRNGEGN